MGKTTKKEPLPKREIPWGFRRADAGPVVFHSFLGRPLFRDYVHRTPAVFGQKIVFCCTRGSLPASVSKSQCDFGGALAPSGTQTSMSNGGPGCSMLASG